MRRDRSTNVVVVENECFGMMRGCAVCVDVGSAGEVIYQRETQVAVALYWCFGHSEYGAQRGARRRVDITCKALGIRRQYEYGSGFWESGIDNRNTWRENRCWYKVLLCTFHGSYLFVPARGGRPPKIAQCRETKYDFPIPLGSLDRGQ